MKIKEYIESGILEAYVLGSASRDEVSELLNLKTIHPQIEDALYELESDLERIAQHMAITPPPNAWAKIENNIHELAKRPETNRLRIQTAPPGKGKERKKRKGQFIEVESQSNHMRVHKLWRWVFAAVFLLGKIFLGFAIYFYLENRQAEEQIEALKTELNQKLKP